MHSINCSHTLAWHWCPNFPSYHTWGRAPRNNEAVCFLPSHTWWPRGRGRDGVVGRELGTLKPLSVQWSGSKEARVLQPSKGRTHTQQKLQGKREPFWIFKEEKQGIQDEYSFYFLFTMR